MSAIITIKIICDNRRCGAAVSLDLESVTAARRVLALRGWKVVLVTNGNNGSRYGDKCPECPAESKTPRRYAEGKKNPASAVIGDALPRRKKT